MKLEIEISISYIYDATGVKLEKKVNDSGQSTTDYTYYAGNYEYNKPDGQSTKLLTFFNSEEGYVEPKIMSMKIIDRLILLMCLIFISCKGDYTYIYSPDKSSCVTIVNKGNIRYIIAGKENSIPNKNYVKLDISEIDKLGDGISGCWNSNGYKWDIINNKSIILENQLDTTKFKFSNKLPLNNRGIPTEIKFKGDNCFVFDFLRKELLPDKGAIIEFE